jgi:hypothetical protein
MKRSTLATWILTASIAATPAALAQTTKPAKAPAQRSHKEMTYPPALPDGATAVTDTSEQFLKSPVKLNDDVTIATTPPTITFMYFPGQDWVGNPWSAWGDSLFVNGKYYASISDHLAPRGGAFVYEYDPATRRLRQMVDVNKVLSLPEGHYTAGKIHGRLDIGGDGWIYFSTHRGSASATTEKFHYKGDWIIRFNPKDGQADVVAHGPVPMHCIPNSVLDPDRMIFYGGTAPGGEKPSDSSGIQFFAYDVKAKKTLFIGLDGPGRYMMFAKSTGRLYYVAGTGEGTLMRYDPAVGNVTPLEGTVMGNRASTQETPQGVIYSVSQSTKAAPAAMWALDTRTETVTKLGTAAVLADGYIASLDADPTGRFLYYVPGAHGSGVREGTPVVQFDTRSGKKKVIAFLADFYTQKYGCTPKGTYSVAVDDTGGKLFITWNVSRNTKAWDVTAMTVIEIPESERK